MSELIDDEFCLVRIRDGAKVINRIFLSDNGISDSPISAKNGCNNQLALSVNGALAQESKGGVSFSKFSFGD